MLIDSSYHANAQCTVAGFTVSGTNGTCASNGVINVAVPGASTCSGWVANLVKTGVPGVYASNPVSATGNSAFTNLPAGTYSVTLVNGAQSFGPQNITITTSYQQLVYTSLINKPCCEDPSAPLYTPATEIVITISSGTGTAPFTYSCTTPSYPTQSSGSTSATTYTFTALPSGETAEITVTDACGTVVHESITLPNVPTPNQLINSVGFYLGKSCKPSTGECTYNISCFFFGSNMTRVANCEYIKAVKNGTDTSSVYPGYVDAASYIGGYGPVSSNDVIEFLITNGCRDTSITITIPDVGTYNTNSGWDQSFLNSTCDTIYRVWVNKKQIDNLPGIHMETRHHCTDSIEMQVERWDPNTSTYVFDTFYPYGSPIYDGNSGNFYAEVSGPGDYRITLTDVCLQSVFNVHVNPYIAQTPVVNTWQTGVSNLEGTDGFGMSVGNLTSPITFSVAPTSGVSSTVLNAVDPGITNHFSGTYTYTWPMVFQTQISPSATTASIVDFPVDEYLITATDVCGRQAQRTITLDKPTSYNFEYFSSGCSAARTVDFDFNAINRGLNTLFELRYKNPDGSVGGIVPGISFANTSLNDNAISNVPPGEYYITCLRQNQQGGGAWQFLSAALPNASNGWGFESLTWSPFYQPITVDTVRSVNIDTEPFFCDFSNPTSGAVAVTLVSGTGLFPVTYDLYSSSDLANPINSYTTPDSSGLNHTFIGLSQGDYTVIASDGCSEFTSTVSVNSSAVAYQISASDTIVCPGSPSIDLWVALDTSVFDISWFDPGMQLIGTGDSISTLAGTFPSGTIMYTVEYVPNASTGCVNPPVQSITIPIEVIADPDLGVSVSDIDLCNDIIYEVTINNTQANYTYELLDASGTSFTPPIFSTGSGGDLMLQYPPSFTPVAGMVLPVVIYNASNTGCGGTLSDSVHVEKQVSNLDLTVTGSTVACPLDQGLISVLNSQNGITYTVIDAVPVDLNSGVGTGDSIGIVIPVNGLVGTYSYQVVASGMNCLTDTLNQSAQVTIIDTTAPSAICQDLTIYLDDMGEAVITASMLDGGSSDACGAVTLSASVLNFDCSDIGANTVTLTVTDESGNSSTCTSEVTVMDTIAPSILSCQQDTTLQLGMNCDVSLPDFTSSSDLQFTDNCSTVQSGLTVSQTPAAGTLISSVTQVTLTISDDSGNSSSCVFMVDVSDTLSPVITSCIGNQVQSVNEYCEAQVNDYTYTDGFTVTDNCSVQDVDMVISQVPAPGTVITSNTVVWLYAMDQGGNVDSCSFLLTLSPCEISIYESFSPNGDNQNEYFYVENLEFFPNTSVIIFNRWGTEVYQSDNYQNDWDGRSQSRYNIAGDELPEGTYFYILQLGMNGNTEVNNGKKYNGYVYLKR